MKLTLDPGAAALLDALHAAGYAAYAVGGCVRDSLLGRTAHDWDLCTSALPQQVMELFGTEQCIPTGLQHGTVTIKYGGQLYETTTFRTEGSYTDGRHPDAVQFVPDVREDLARRDFTINAMAYNAAEGLVDPLAGKKTCKTVCCVRWASRSSGLPRTRCASCGCTALPQDSALRWTQPQPGRRGSWHRIWTASLPSAFRRNWQSCWLPRSRGRIWNPPCWRWCCRS